MNILHRLVVAVQTRGNLGKSLAINGLCDWLKKNQIEWCGFDLDADHQSLARVFPGAVSLVELGEEPEGDLIRILKHCVQSPITVIDPRAHMSQVILRTWEMLRFPESFAEAGGRITVLLFVADDLEVMTDIDQTVTRLGDSVDYVVVKNRARAPRTRMHDGSELESCLNEFGAEELEIPVLLSLARNQLAAQEAALGRGISYVEAIANRDLKFDPMVRLIIEDWIKTLFRRLDRLSGKFLTTALAGKIAPVDTRPLMSAPVIRGAKINRNNL